jgi:hypothetical protein
MNTNEKYNTNLTAEERASCAAWVNDVYSKFDANQKLAYDRTLGAWGFASCAQECYNARASKSLTDGQKTYACGMWAERAIAAVRDLCGIWKVGRQTALAKMDELCDWVGRHGGHAAMPSRTDAIGKVYPKTAAETYGDMMADYKAMWAQKDKAEAEKAAKGGAR